MDFSRAMSLDSFAGRESLLNFSELGREPVIIPAAGQAEHGAGSGHSWRSRSWSNTRCHRAGPAGSSHSWPAPADRCTPHHQLPWAGWLLLKRRGEGREG